MAGSYRIRPYRPADRRAVRRICCETGAAGDPVDALFSDREVFADYLTRYYTDFEPETTFVAECDGEVVGYLTGCLRYRRYRWIQALLMALAVAPKVLVRLARGRYDARDRSFLRWCVRRGARETPRAPARACHFHFNLLPAHRRHGAGRRLFLAFLRALERAGAERVYGRIQVGPRRRRERTFRRFGFRCIDRRRLTKFGGDEPRYVATFVRELGSGGGGLTLKPS